jgi:hypothetical protein
MSSVAELPSRRGIALSLVVPCHDEKEGNDELQSYEIGLVSDGSKDATRDRILRLTQRDRRVAGIDLAGNQGHQIALSAELEFRRGARLGAATGRLCRARERASHAIDTCAGAGVAALIWIGVGPALSLVTSAPVSAACRWATART